MNHEEDIIVHFSGIVLVKIDLFIGGLVKGNLEDDYKSGSG